MPIITILEFFDTIFNELDPTTETIFCTTFDKHPSDGDGWPCNSGPKAIARRKRRAAEYFCTSSVKAVEAGRPRRNGENLERAYVLVLDDVGQKAPENSLKPTYKIRTSDGSYHWGYKYAEPLVVAEGIAEKLVRAVYTGRGLTDEGGKMVAKMVRPPAGVNFKYPEVPEVELTEWNPEVSYTVDEMVEAWSLDLDAIAVSSVAESVAGLPAGAVIHDEVLDWLHAQGHVTSDDGGEWVKIQCPWHKKHTSGGEDASYSPLGRGARPEFRGYSCFHSHEHKTADFLEWVEEQGGPCASVRDVVGLLVQQYVLLVGSNEVADVLARPLDQYPIVPLPFWRAAHKQVSHRGDSGKEFIICDEWQKSARMKRLDGKVYMPGAGMYPEGRYLNLYRAPVHAETRGEPSWFLDHIKWVIPDAEQCSLVLDWLAHKIQHPERRSYGVVMVADFAGVADGDKYGIGRSMIGDAMRCVMQSGVVSVDLEDVVGRGGQSAYNEWAADSQLIIVEETKEEVGDWKQDVNHYERLKGFIDPKVIRGVRIKPKYGRVRVVDLYFNMMLITNHGDALALPIGDRRLLVVGNNTRRRTHSEYAGVLRALEDPVAIAQLHGWFMQREVCANMVLPMMTPEKQRMTEIAATTLDEAWGITLDRLVGDLVTQKQLMRTMELVVSVELEDERMVPLAKNYARRKYRSLPYLEPGNRQSRVYDGANYVSCKVLRNSGEWVMRWSEGVRNPKVFLDEIAKNSQKTVKTM